jgi:hypothetical protein
MNLPSGAPLHIFNSHPVRVLLIQMFKRCYGTILWPSDLYSYNILQHNMKYMREFDKGEGP